MTISILGCGWYGRALAKILLQKEFTVKGSSTSPPKMDELASLGIVPYLVQINAETENFDDVFFDCDVLIVSISPKFRYSESGEYLSKIKKIISIVHQNKISRVIYISSTGVYADSNREVNELNDPEPDTEAGKLLFEAEKLFQAETAFKTTIIRFAGLVGPGRHPGHFFAGKKGIPNGKAPVNLIHLDDCVAITSNIIEKDAYGYLFNACCPDHPSKVDFYGKASLQSGLTVPEFIDELNNWKIVNSISLPKILGYQFKVTEWGDFNFGRE